MKKIAIVLIGLMFSIQSYCDYSKNEIQKINNSLIYDLFMNYELTVKNGNLSTVVDFFPCMNNVNFKNIRLTSFRVFWAMCILTWFPETSKL